MYFRHQIIKSVGLAPYVLNIEYRTLNFVLEEIFSHILDVK